MANIHRRQEWFPGKEAVRMFRQNEDRKIQAHVVNMVYTEIASKIQGLFQEFQEKKCFSRTRLV